MGNSLSLSPRDTLSGDDLKRNSKEITEMSNALFQFMYTNWQPRDVWEIANDPSKYVIAISDEITTQFHVLGYKTKSGRIGEIYFQKWDALEPPMSKDQYATANARNSTLNKSSVIESKRKTRRERGDAGYPAQKQNAEIIAFYFVRIFQILGAMLLVVKDINIPDYNKQTGQTITGEVKMNSLREFAQQSHQVVSGFRPPTFKGGARDSFDTGMALGPYDFLRFYLRRISAEDISRFKNVSIDTKKEFIFDKSDTMLFEFNPYPGASTIEADSSKTFQKIGFIVKLGGSYNKVYINVSVKEIKFDVNHSEADTLQGYKAPSEREDKDKLSSYPIRLTLEYNVPGKKSSVMITRVSELPPNLNTGAEYQFSSDDNGLITFLRSQGYHLRNDFVKILENITMFYIKQTNSSIEQIKFEEKKKIENDNSMGSKVRAPRNKSLETTFKQLTKNDYQPHCIARALQLLDPASINNFKTGTAISNVCVPKLGGTTKSLSEYVPTRSVGQLYGKINPLDYKASIEVLKAFVQKESSGDPLTTDGVNNIPSESTDLQAAIERLSKAFGIEYTNQKSFSSIEIKVSKKCDPTKDLGKPVEVIRQSNKFNAMKSASQQLLAYHLKQVIEISKFLKKIFNISQRPDGSWKVEGPKTELLFAGFETMNALTDQARALLINYYAGCEEIYQRGVKAWEVDIETSGDKALVTSAPVAGVVLPSAPVAPAASAPPR